MRFLEFESIHRDARRVIRNLLKTDIKDINYYEARKGVTLGEHYHKNTFEYFFITSGRGILHVDDSTEKIWPKSLFVVEPGKKHSIECLTDLKFLTFLTEPYDDKHPDMHPSLY